MRDALHPGMSTQENRAIYERFVREVLEQGNLAVLDELLAENALSHVMSDQPGRAGVAEGLRRFNAAFTERRIAVRDMIAEADRVVGYFTVTALHQGHFLGIAATGERITYDGMSIVRLEDGKIVEHWSVNNLVNVLHAVEARAARAEESTYPNLIPIAQTEVIKRFFDEYAARFNRSLAGEPVDSKEVASSFADHFVEASPAGVNGGKNGMLFRWIIPSGFAHYRKLGTTSMQVESVEVESLDPMHAMAKVHWDSRYTKQDGAHDRIEFDVTYLLHFEGAKPKIFAYITGDEDKMLREHGLS